jgi:transcriptional regulatory protein LevR
MQLEVAVASSVAVVVSRLLAMAELAEVDLPTQQTPHSPL